MDERRFPRELGSLEPMSRFVAAYLDSRGIDPEHSFTIDLLIEELFTNMLKYGKGGGSDVGLGLAGEGPVVVITLRDFDVEPFDVTAVPEVDTSSPLDERRPGGLGIHLVRRFSDNFRYEYKDRDVIITITKKLDP